MTRTNRLIVCVSILALAFALGSVVNADPWNKKTVLTVSETMRVPGAVLTPGKYVMKLADSQSNRHVVQIFNEDEDQLITTILAIPNWRLQPTGKTELHFWEGRNGSPIALKAWFYPGDNTGQEFVYPKPDAVTIETTVAGASVPVVTEEMEAELKVEEPTVTLAETRVQESERIETPAPAVSEEEEMVEEQPAGEEVVAQKGAGSYRSSRASRLPATASPFPLFGLIGFASLATGAALHGLRKLLS